MSSFVAGFSARHAAPAELLAAALAPCAGFATVDIVRPQPAPRHYAPAAARPAGPRHFSPADRTVNPTEGWDPLDPDLGPEPAGIDPVEAARAAGYAEGLAAAAAATQQGADRDQALLSGLADAIGSAARVDRDTIARHLRDTVLHLVTQLVGEVGVSPERLATRIDAASEMLAEKSESALLRVHPDDVALLDGRLPQSIFAVGDAHVARGSFVLESASTVVEDGPELWLEQLAQTIDRVPVPQC
jgi:flagellar assembly protein FliH